MYSDTLEALIKAALVDGELTEKEKQILMKRAEAEGVDLDEFEMVLSARLFEVQNSVKKAAPVAAEKKSDKFGDMCKCPACGAIVKSGMAKCEECGYAFANVDATRTAERLYEELQKINSSDSKKEDDSLLDVFNPFKMMNMMKPSEETRKRMDLISNFPVPNSRADLIDMLSSIQAKANSKAPKDGKDKRTYGEDLGYAYWLLYINCINKAKISFANDASFKPYFDFYDSELARSKKKFGFF